VNADEFCRLAYDLTGTLVKELQGTDRDILNELLADDTRTVGHSQLNELLLLVNKDRMERPFFDHFFGPSCTVAGLRAGVRKFQQMAMLCHGNFIHSYRTLCRFGSLDSLNQELGEWSRSAEELVERFTARSPKLVDVDSIARQDTPLVGYLSAGQIGAEFVRAKFLQELLPPLAGRPAASWESYQTAIFATANSKEHSPLMAVLSNFRARNSGATIADFAAHLEVVVAQLEERKRTLEAVRRRATRNQDIYLTWDHMDVYFATSMRKRWEYEDLYDFVNGLMASSELTDLNLRHFDPTQAYTDNRVNKGLVESLMLKRARCTVYSVQDTDTLGKDSELAATLAQGKPVIAYVPRIEVAKRAEQLVAEDPTTIQDRLRFVIYADDQFAQSLQPAPAELSGGLEGENGSEHRVASHQGRPSRALGGSGKAFLRHGTAFRGVSPAPLRPGR
jgi:hypothetical protein